MCNFLSGIGFPDGSIKTSDATESHEHLILAFGLKESINLSKNGWVRFEYSPEDIIDMCDITKYRLTIDQVIIPDWVTDEIMESWERKANQLVKGMILLDGEIPILLGGKWIFGGNVIVNSIVNSIIVSMWGGSIKDMWGAINDMRGGSINDMRGGSINDMWGGSINDMWGGSIINDKRNNKEAK